MTNFEWQIALEWDDLDNVVRNMKVLEPVIFDSK